MPGIVNKNLLKLYSYNYIAIAIQEIASPNTLILQRRQPKDYWIEMSNHANQLLNAWNVKTVQ